MSSNQESGGPGQDDSFVTPVEYPRPFDDYVVRLCTNAARYVYILSPTLDHAVFSRRELVEALSTLVRGSNQTARKKAPSLSGNTVPKTASPD